MKEKTKSSKTQRGNKTSKNLIPALIGLILILIILALMVFSPDPTHEQFLIYRIVLALACGGLAAIIPGFFKINYKNTVQASGALGVFTLVYLFNPAGTEAKSFDFTVFVETDQGETALKNQGKLILKIDDEKDPQKIDEEGSVTYKNILITNKNKTHTLQLEADGWQFENGKVSTSIFLKDDNTTVIVTRDNSLCCVSGSVRNENSEFLTNVKVSIGDIITETNEHGRFHIEIPKEKQKEEQKLTAKIEGYEIYDAIVYPGTKQEVDIIMRKR